MARDDLNPNAFAAAAFGPAGDCMWQEGMTLRDWFAGQALAGIAANVDPESPFTVKNAKIAQIAYAMAGAMLEARRPTPAKERGG